MASHLIQNTSLSPCRPHAASMIRHLPILWDQLPISIPLPSPQLHQLPGGSPVLPHDSVPVGILTPCLPPLLPVPSCHFIFIWVPVTSECPAQGLGSGGTLPLTSSVTLSKPLSLSGLTLLV